MSSLIAPAYTFTPGAPGVGTINLSGITNFNVANLTGIVDVTKNTIVYARGISGYTAISGTTLTLAADTSALSSSDVLAIKYDALGGADGYIPSGAPFSATAAGTLFQVDTTGYSSIAVQITSAGTTCTITYQTSNDGTTWYSTWGTASSNLGNTAQVSTSTALGLYTFNCSARYFRAQVTTYTSGTVTITPIMRTITLQTMEVDVGNTVTTTVSGTVAITGTTTSAKATTGGLSQYQYIAATATNVNSAVIKSSAGQIYGYHFINAATTARYVHFYNTTAVPTMGTTAAVRVVGIPASSSVFYNASDIGISFSTGISIAITTAAAATDNTTTNIAANDVVGMIDYN